MASKSMGQEKAADCAWRQLIAKYRIDREVSEKGTFLIGADQIKEFREPRLMAKWDSEESLPAVLKEKRLNLLPVSRKAYVMSDFALYQKLPPLGEAEREMEEIHFKSRYESVNLQEISSESNAINVLLLSDVLDRFLESEGTVETFNGRMGTGSFDFEVNSYTGTPRRVAVEGAQCEIDGGFENDSHVIIMEAKNVLHPDFHVRQLYYPYRLRMSRVKKPIRLVFSQYVNQIYRLLEYRFDDPMDYSSIRLVKEACYSLAPVRITEEDLYRLWKETDVLTDDSQCGSGTPPFPQADSMWRVISLLEQLAEQDMTTEEIAERMQFRVRQSDYYFNAGAYLGLFQKVTTKEGVVVKLSSLGRKVYAMPYRDRQLKLAALLLEHRVFHDLFGQMVVGGKVPEKSKIVEEMMRSSVCSESVARRRASTVASWLRWMQGLTQSEENQ